MRYPRLVLPALILAGTFATACYADAPNAAEAGAVATAAHSAHHGHRHGLFGILHQLHLSADQQTKVKAILAQAKPRRQALHEATLSNRSQLATTPPTDPGYAALVQTAQNDAAARVQLRSDLWTQIYAVLTPAQQQQLPQLVAARQQAHKDRAEAWRAQPPVS
jgi:Spy/CpxP family protein refolding chaperone